VIVLHGLAAADGDLALWAEDSELPARSATRPARAPSPHPFAVPSATLAELLPVPAGTSKAGQHTILLPTRGWGPSASPELIRAPLTGGRPSRALPQLRPWLVPTVALPPVVAATLLSTVVDDPAAIPDCRAGAAVRYLAGVARLAADLVTRGKVLPTLVHRPSSARWAAAPLGADAARFAALRETMPAAVRAEQVEADSLTGREPAEVLRGLLDRFVDAAVRAVLTGQRLRLRPARRGRLPAKDAAADAWLRALVGEPDFTADPALLAQLGNRLTAWRASGMSTSPVRTCFRLHSPEQFELPDLDDFDLDGGGTDEAGESTEQPEPRWRLEFLLQAVDEPSVLVPADQVWPDRDGVLYRWVDHPQELLLHDLGKASRLFPDLDTALRERRPAELQLDTEGAYRFLTSASALDQAGFGVLLPSWWQQPRELGLTLTTASRGTAGVVAKHTEAGLQALVDYRWDLAIGDQQLTEAELLALAKAKVPLVRVRGQWVHVDRKRLAAGLAFLERAGSGQMPASEILLHAAHPDGEQVPMPIIAVSDRGWLGELLSGTVDEQLEPVEPPAGFTATLRPYQRRGLAWLAFLDRLGLGACLADDMGLGKTVQLLALEALARSERTRPPTLLVCPMTLVGTWQREAARFAPMLSVHIHHGADRLTGDDLVVAANEHDLLITTYALAAKDSEPLGEVRWDRVVLDEAQNIKNSASRQSQAVRQLPARHRVALTGTPVENRLAELWSIMDFVNPGVLGTVNSFRARFSVPVERDGDQEAAARLRKLTGPFVLRRLKTDPRIIDDLPDKFEMKQLCTLTAEQASLYQAVVDDMLARIEDSDGMERRGLVLATMSKLKQVCNHPAQLLSDGSRIGGRSGKLSRLEEILTGALADGDKVLCFTQFASFASMLVPYLSARFDQEVLFLHGGTSKGARDQAVQRFQSADGPSIFLLSLKAGGTGLTLTAANQVVHLDRWWNPAVEDQATDRAFRIGQRRDVQVRKFVCIGTLEEKIDKMIEEKKALAQLVVGAGENWLTELSTGQLRELVTLSAEAVID
jgi:SNF2 family DNA or RNA helicase